MIATVGEVSLCRVRERAKEPSSLSRSTNIAIICSSTHLKKKLHFSLCVFLNRTCSDLTRFVSKHNKCRCRAEVNKAVLLTVHDARRLTPRQTAVYCLLERPALNE